MKNIPPLSLLPSAPLPNWDELLLGTSICGWVSKYQAYPTLQLVGGVSVRLSILREAKYLLRQNRLLSAVDEQAIDTMLGLRCIVTLNIARKCLDWDLSGGLDYSNKTCRNIFIALINLHSLLKVDIQRKINMASNSRETVNLISSLLDQRYPEIMLSSMNWRGADFTLEKNSPLRHITISNLDSFGKFNGPWNADVSNLVRLIQLQQDRFGQKLSVLKIVVETNDERELFAERLTKSLLKQLIYKHYQDSLHDAITFLLYSRTDELEDWVFKGEIIPLPLVQSLLRPAA